MPEITRRGFVNQSLQGAAGVAAGSSVVAASRRARAAAANDKVVLALIGAGGRGRGLGTGFARLKDVELKYVCDVDDSRGDASTKEIEGVQGRRPQRVKDMRRVKVFNMLGGRSWSPVADSQVPEGLDWDMWLGPAQRRPYNVDRHRRWKIYWDYVGGSLSGDASHNIDLARLVIGDPPHPKSVYCAGGRLAFDDEREAPDMQAITYDFGDFTMTCESTAFPPYMKKSQGDVRFGDKFPYWPQNSTRIEIYGTKQMMYVGRHGGG